MQHKQEFLLFSKERAQPYIQHIHCTFTTGMFIPSSVRRTGTGGDGPGNEHDPRDALNVVMTSSSSRDGLVTGRTETPALGLSHTTRTVSPLVPAHKAIQALYAKWAQALSNRNEKPSDVLIRVLWCSVALPVTLLCTRRRSIASANSPARMRCAPWQMMLPTVWVLPVFTSFLDSNSDARFSLDDKGI